MSTLSGLSNLNWSPQGLMGSFQSMGAKATSPATNVAPPSNTIKPNLATPNTPSGLSLANYNKSTRASNPGLFGSPTVTQTPNKSTAGMTPYTGTGSFQTINGKNYSVPTPGTPTTPTAPIAPVTPPANTGVYGQATQALAGTQPSSTSTAATTALQSNATGQYQTPAQLINQGNIQQGAQTSANLSQNQTPAVTDAENAYNTFAQQNPYMLAAQSNPDVAADVASGRTALLGQTFAAEQAAKAQAVQNALTGQGQQITAAGQQGNLGVAGQQNQNTAAASAGSIANTAQSNQITGQSNAANVTQPSVAGYGQTSFNPATNSFGTTGGGSGVSPNDPFYSTMQQYAQMAANGQMSSIPTSITGNSVLNAQMNQMAKAINPNYNPVVSSAQSASTASNVQTAGTAATNASNTGYSGAVQEYQNNNANYTALTGISSQVTGTLQNYANTGALTDYNAAVNSLQSHLSNPDYQKFVTAIGNAQASYQAILGSSGVTPTKADQDAVNALNPNSSASTIVAALNQLSADAHALIIVPSYQKVQNYKQQLGIQ